MPLIRNKKTGVTLNATARLVRLAELRNDLELVDDGKPISRDVGAELDRIRRAEKAARKMGADARAENLPDHDAVAKSKKIDRSASLQKLKDRAEGVEEGNKDALEEMALENFGVKLDKRKAFESLRKELIGLINEHMEG